MRLKVTRSKNAASLYVIKSVYNPVTKSNSSKIVEKLGTEGELREKLGGADPYEWANEYIKELNLREKENKRAIMVPYSPAKQIPYGVQHAFNGGYLFLQKIYHQLDLDGICKEISNRHRFTYDLNSILSCLLYARVLYPASKKATCELSHRFIQPPNFEEYQVYRALEVIAKEGDYIQSQLYKNSRKIFPRSSKVLFYDCTNFFFEIEETDGLKQYGKSKENRPNPIVQMGLFIDGHGIPLAFSITSGNTNEQVTLQPLEKKILSDFELAKFIVCTDAGLSSAANRKFNHKNDRAFITTQSIKKLKKHLKEWALDPFGWRISQQQEHGCDTKTLPTYNISSIQNYKARTDENGNEFSEEEQDARIKRRDKMRAITFYKERWIKEDGLEQKLIVTYSLKYSDYKRKIRNKQIERAAQLMQQAPGKVKKKGQNDYKRFVQQQTCTKDGEKTEHTFYQLDETLIQDEMQYDGFYAVCTNLESAISEVVEINRGRWEIEESFRIMKSEFKSRPVFLRRDDRIEAHFTTCFLSLLLYRLLEKTLNNEFNAQKLKRSEEKYTCPEIIQTLRDMNLYKISQEGYVPTYQRTQLTDALHDKFGFRTDFEIVTDKEMKKIKKFTTR